MAKLYKMENEFLTAKYQEDADTELHILKECNHPFISKYVDYFKKDKRHCIVT